MEQELIEGFTPEPPVDFAQTPDANKPLGLLLLGKRSTGTVVALDTTSGCKEVLTVPSRNLSLEIQDEDVKLLPSEYRMDKTDIVEVDQGKVLI